MVDVHSHLLFNVDDGSKSLEQSISILKDLENNNFQGVILTPHYIKDSKYNNTKEDNLKILDILKKELKKQKINIDLYLGNEIFIDNNIKELIEKGIVSSLNNSNYFLIELPIFGDYPNYEEIFKDLIISGYKVILAHPERYYAFQKDFNKIYELESIGVLFQSNLDSIVGGYGKKAKKMARRLLKEKKITFLATDIHHKKRNYSKWNKAKWIALKYLTEEEFNKITSLNAKRLLKL